MTPVITAADDSFPEGHQSLKLSISAAATSRSGSGSVAASRRGPERVIANCNQGPI